MTIDEIEELINPYLGYKTKIAYLADWDPDYNIPEDVIADELYVSKTTVRTYINDIYFEVGILATFNNLINKGMFAS